MIFSEQSYNNGKTCAQCIKKRFENRHNDIYYWAPFCRNCPHLKQFLIAPTEEICVSGGCCWCPWGDLCDHEMID
jgi:hypothetical protein